jgi:hypothetical protein
MTRRTVGTLWKRASVTYCISCNNFWISSDTVAPDKKVSRPLACPKGPATKAKQPEEFRECGDATYHLIHG